MLRLRRATRDEGAALSALALRSKAHWGYDEEFLEAARAELTVGPDEIDSLRIIVAERDDDIVGFYGLGVDPPTADLAYMFVAPEAIGHGIGRALWDHAVAAASALGLARLSIEADPHAEDFYRSMGAALVGSAPSRSIPGRDLPLFHYALSQ